MSCQKTENKNSGLKLWCITESPLKLVKTPYAQAPSTNQVLPAIQYLSNRCLHYSINQKKGTTISNVKSNSK